MQTDLLLLKGAFNKLSFIVNGVRVEPPTERTMGRLLSRDSSGVTAEEEKKLIDGAYMSQTHGFASVSHSHSCLFALANCAAQY